MSLTEEQRTAVGHPGHLLLTACPGSGKTRVIVSRLAREVERLRGTPRAAACITYTNTAVQEIEQRLAARLQPGDQRHYSVTTIHSFCLNSILRPFAWMVPGFNGTMKVLTRDRPEFEAIVRHAAARVNLVRIDARDYEAFSSLNLDAQGQLIGAALGNEAVARAAPHFWARCEQFGFVDFANIVYKSYCLIRDHPQIAGSLGARFASFLIDEFQDTTELQLEILKLIHAQGRASFFAVGDPAQSIFGFTGARPELVVPFGEHIQARMDLSLSGNFRSNPQVVDHSERLFARQPAMKSVGDNRNCAIAPELVRGRTTFQAITEVFLPKLRDAGIALGDAAILAREWAPLFSLSRQLRDFGVPIVGPGARPYRRSRLFASLAEQLCGYLVDPGGHNIRQLERALSQAVQDVTVQNNSHVYTFEGRIVLARLLREARRLRTIGGASQWLDHMSQATGDILAAANFIDRADTGLFFASVQEMKADMRNQRPPVDVANLTVEDLGLFANPSGALRLGTIHYAKGREYKGVALINLRQGVFPHFRAEDLEAEKRLFYVGVTRAERVLVYIAEPDQWGNPPSSFLRAGGLGLC